MSNTKSVAIDELIGNVQEDLNLMSEEKEFIVSGTKADSEIQIYTEIGSMIRQLFTHSEFMPHDIRDLNRNRRSPEEYTGETVTGVYGRIPVGCRKVRASSRSTSHHADVVSRGNGQDEDSDTVSAQEYQANEESEADDD